MPGRFVRAAVLVGFSGLLLLSGEAHAKPRPLLFGCGMIWARWLVYPWEYDGQSMDQIVAMGGTYTSASFDWVDLEPSPGAWAWDYADHTVDEAQARGLVQVAYVGNTAIWALPPGVPLEYSYRYPPDEAYVDEFMNYCRTVAARYAGRVNRFQFWNEPNGCSWVNDGCGNADGYPLYTRWLKRAYVALKEGNPNCIVAAGALDYHSGVTGGWRYIEGMYQEGAKGYFDAISIHPYSSAGIHWQALVDTHNVMAAWGDGDKPVWLTEYGWSESTSNDQYKAQQITEVLTALKSDEYDYVEMANYLCITDLPDDSNPDYGLCNRNLSRRPSWYAFRDVDKTWPNTPTPEATPTPGTPTAAPTATSTPLPGQELLVNPGFEADGEDFVNPPLGWSHLQVNESWDGTLAANSWLEIVTPPGGGSYCAGKVTNWGSPRLYCYQEVAAVPGTRYNCTVEVFTPVTTLPEHAGKVRLGVDPNGGTSVISSDIQWTASTDSPAGYTRIGFSGDDAAKATGSKLTLFLEARTFEIRPWNAMLFDDASVVAVLGPTPTATPPPDRDGDSVPDSVEAGKFAGAGTTNGYLPDSDGDGLDDGVEDANRNGSRDVGETDPRNRDCDGDGYEDGIEVLFLGTSPLAASDPGGSAVDGDGDGLPSSLDLDDADPDQDDDRFADGYEAVVLGMAAVTSPAQTPPLGDVNGNGIWDEIDAQLILKFFSGRNAPGFLPDRSDLDRNGIIDNADAQISLNYLAGVQALLPGNR